MEDYIPVTEIMPQGGKHLIFKLCEKDYGIQILRINEIIGLMEITPLPKVPNFLKGVINLRGKIIPVIDLRLKLNMQEREYDERTCIVIINIENSQNENDLVGIVVDMVSEVYDMPSSEIETNVQYGADVENSYLTGIGKIKDKVVMLLDIEAIINFDSIKQLY